MGGVYGGAGGREMRPVGMATSPFLLPFLPVMSKKTAPAAAANASNPPTPPKMTPVGALHCFSPLLMIGGGGKLFPMTVFAPAYTRGESAQLSVSTVCQPM
jgi:hypothetical protein